MLCIIIIIIHLRIFVKLVRAIYIRRVYYIRGGGGVGQIVYDVHIVRYYIILLFIGFRLGAHNNNTGWIQDFK